VPWPRVVISLRRASSGKLSCRVRTRPLAELPDDLADATVVGRVVEHP
jgi:hypothetical protein